MQVCTIRQVPAKLHRIKLSESERQELEAIRDHKRGNPSRVLRAIALLLSDEGPAGPALKDSEIRLATGMTPSTLERLRIRCCEVGPIGALERKAREKPPREVKITGDVQARVIQLACSKPPAGRARWTLRLIAQHLVEIEVIDTISHQSVGTIFKKANSSPGGRTVGASRPSRMPPS